MLKLWASLGVMMQALVQQLLYFSLHSYKGVRDTAVLALESCMKQYPAYIMQLLPVPLAALAKLPIPQADLTTQVHDLAPEELDSLRGAMREAASSSTVTASSKADDASAAGEYWHSISSRALRPFLALSACPDLRLISALYLLCLSDAVQRIRPALYRRDVLSCSVLF